MKKSIYAMLCSYIESLSEEQYGAKLVFHLDGEKMYSFDTWYLEGIIYAERQANHFLEMGYLKVTVDGCNVNFAK